MSAPLPTHAYTLLRTTCTGPTGCFRTKFTPTSEPTVLAITPSYQLAQTMLAKHKKDLTSRENVDKYATAMWRNRDDGCDIMLTPREGRRTTEVRLRIRRADVVGEMEGRDVVRVGEGERRWSVV